MDSSAATDRRFVALALSLGRRNLGRVWPNPAVGCVLVREGQVVGRGWTAPGGRPHAEVQALSQAGRAAAGATAYVTLEPCAHHGQTGPCATALIEAGVARVVSALQDPDPRVAGQGHALLRNAGIGVETGLMADEATIDHAGFLSRVARGRPIVTLKLATSLDGRIATAGGESRWITGAQARRQVHHMRMTHDAVMVGRATALADNPDLRARDLGAPSQPVRVIVDSELSLPLDLTVFETAADVPTWVVCGPQAADDRRGALQARSVKVLAVETRNGQVDLSAALTALGDAGLTRILCEGGGKLAASLLADNLADRLAVFSAGLVIGADARPAVAELGIGRLAQAPGFNLISQARAGADTFSLWQLRSAP